MNAKAQIRIWENFQLLKIAQTERVKQDLNFSYMESTQRQGSVILNLRSRRVVQKAGKEMLIISTRFDLVLQISLWSHIGIKAVAVLWAMMQIGMYVAGQVAIVPSKSKHRGALRVVPSSTGSALK